MPLSLFLNTSGSTFTTDITAYLLQADWQLGREHPDAIMPADGKARFIMNNADLRFSPENDSSPLFGMLQGNRIRVVLDGTTIMWQGWIEAVEVDVETEKRAVLIGDQGMGRLRQMPAGLPVQLNQRANAIIDMALTRLIAAPTLFNNWSLGIKGSLGVDSYLYNPGDQLNDEDGRSVFPYVGDTWDATTSVYDVIRELVQSEHGVFWQDRQGRFQFRNRHYWTLQDTAAMTIAVDTDTVAAEYDYGRTIANVVRVTAYPRQIEENFAVIWQTIEPLRIGANTTQTVTARLHDEGGLPVGALDYGVPIPHVDFTATDDNGADITAAVSVAIALEGQVARITFTNNSGKAANITLQLRGQIISRDDAVVFEVSNPQSVVDYGPRRADFDLPALSQLGEVEDFARWYLYENGQPQGQLRAFTLINRDAAALTRMTLAAFGTRITVTASQPDHSRDYFIVGEQYHWTPQKGLRGTYPLRPANIVDYWELGESQLNEDTRLAY